MDASLDGMEPVKQNSLAVPMEALQVEQVMSLDENGSRAEPVDQSIPEVSMEVHQFVEELVNNAEAIQKKNTRLKKEISLLKKKYKKVQEYEKLNRKHKLEMLKQFRSYLEERTDKSKTGCKSCPSLQSDLQKVKINLSKLLEEQVNAEERVWDIQQDIKLKKVIEESKIYENKEFEQQCEKRKADESKHFLRAKFEAFCERDKIKADLGPRACKEYVLAAQKAATVIVMSKAFDEIPDKIAALEEEARFEAMDEVTKEIAEKDNIFSKKQQRKACWPLPIKMDYYFDQADEDRRTRSMERIYIPKTHI